MLPGQENYIVGNGWTCSCGAWVPMYQYHTCPTTYPTINIEWPPLDIWPTTEETQLDRIEANQEKILELLKKL